MMKDDLKSRFRKKCLDRLRRKVTKYKKNKLVVNNLLNLLKKKKFKNILLYIPLDSEVDIRPIITYLRKKGIYNIFVPYMVGDSFKIVKFRLPLKKKKFGIKEPKNSYLKAKIDIAIVPIVGVDKLNGRIGFGKGMYDRFFGRLDYKPKIIFTQLQLCKTSLILSSSYDIKSDLIVTSTKNMY